MFPPSSPQAASVVFAASKNGVSLIVKCTAEHLVSMTIQNLQSYDSFIPVVCKSHDQHGLQVGCASGSKATLLHHSITSLRYSASVIVGTKVAHLCI